MSVAPHLALARFTVALAAQTDFAGWREAARRLMLNGVKPEEIAWTVDRLRVDETAAALPAVPQGFRS